jgi:hypothetical protein
MDATTRTPETLKNRDLDDDGAWWFCPKCNSECCTPVETHTEYSDVGAGWNAVEVPWEAFEPTVATCDSEDCGYQVALIQDEDAAIGDSYEGRYTARERLDHHHPPRAHWER